MKYSNENKCIIIQIEDYEAYDELEEICATPGIDMIFFGPADFAHSLGLAHDMGNPKIEEARRRVAEVARKHGKIAGTVGGLGNLKELYEMGYRFVNLGADVVALGQYFTKLADDAKAIRDSLSLEEIWEKTKSKRYSHARIRRLCMNAFLGVEDGLHRQLPPYLRVLGFNSNGREILAALRKNGKIPASGSLADLASSSETAAEFARLEAQSVDLYNLFEQELKPCGQDFRFSPIRL
jgi:hypothetical protein